MGQFGLCVLQYLLEAVVIAAVAFGATKLGIALRKKKNAKE